MGQQLNLATSSTGGFIPVMPPPVLALRDPTTSDTNYPVGIQWFNKDTDELFVYKGAGIWGSEGEVQATETVAGIAEISSAAEALAGTDDTTIMTPAKVALVAIAGAPLWSEVTPGIVERASTAEAQAGASDTVGMSPLKTVQLLATPPAIGGTTPGAATFTSLTSSGGTVSLGATSASNITLTGAIDLTLASTGGSLVVNAGEAVADAIDLNAAAGGLDVDVALLASITSTRNNAQAILLEATLGGIDILASGAGAGEDIDIIATGSSINLSATENAADSITITSTAGGIDITAAGAATEDIDIVNTAGSIILNAGEAVSDAINVDSAGGFDLDAAGQVNIASSQNAADSIVIVSSAGGIDILASGAAAGEDIDIVATGSSVNISATENDAGAITIGTNGGTSERITVTCSQGTNAASIGLTSTAGGLTLTAGLATADAINLVTSNASGGIDVDAGTAGFIVDTTGAISLDAAAASNFTATGAFDVTVSSTAGSINISGGEAAADALNFDAAAGGLDVDVALQMNLDSSQAAATAVRIIASNAGGGIDVDAGTGGITVDTTGALSLDSAAASNFTVTGAFDLTLASSLGSVNITAGESAADSIVISSAIGGIDILAAGAAAGEDIDIIATGSSVNISATESAADSITIVSTAGGIDILASGAAAGEDIDIIATGSSVNISATESATDSITIISTAGGIDISASGAAAGEDIDITATGSSINLTATESVVDGIVINASGAAGGVQIAAGTNGILMNSGQKVKITSVATAASPYTVLGTDYFISTDSTGGALTLTLPASPATGRVLVVYDGAGQAAAGGNVTIDGNSKNIAAGGTSAATKLVNTAYESYILTYNGTLWCGQNIV